MFGYIYQITNNINKKTYIGKKYGAFNESYYGSGTLIKKAIQKYGQNSFTNKMLCECIDEEDINNKEKYYIEKIKPEYNIAKGGSGGDTLLLADKNYKKQIIEKRSLAISKAWSEKSVEEKQKWKKAISDSKKGKKYYRPNYKHSDEVKQKIKESNKLTHSNRSDEHKNNLKIAAEKRKGTINPNCWKKIMIGNNVYQSYKQAANKLNVSRQTINKWVKKGKAILI
jgi:group I intron endonuclease